MDERTLIALHGAIKRWEGIVAGTKSNGGSADCPLCELFFTVYTPPQNYCRGCPVVEKTGKPHCRETPYDDWLEAGRRTGDTPEAIEAATAMLNFLKSLLP